MSEDREARRFDALVNYPGWGSLWLDNVRLRDGVVVGTHLFPHPASTAHYERLTMSFPLSCVRKVEAR